MGRKQHVAVTVVVLVTMLFLVVTCRVHGATVTRSGSDIVDNSLVQTLDKSQFEAAFQGRCGHGSACEQLCYELHDGMYECDCRRGFELNKDGYSCYEMNGTATDHGDNEKEGEDILYQKDASFSAELAVALGGNTSEYTDPSIAQGPEVTTQSPNLEQKVPSGSSLPKATQSLSTVIPEAPCVRDCGLGGSCALDDVTPGTQFCECPLGRGGDYCEKDVEIRSPRFTGRSWLAFPALRAAYKHVQVTLELRPEAYDGIFLLTGERDDMAGDFMALLLHQGFVEFRVGTRSHSVAEDEKHPLNAEDYSRAYMYKQPSPMGTVRFRHANTIRTRFCDGDRF